MKYNYNNHFVYDDNVRFGSNVKVFPFAVIGKPPMAPKGVTNNPNMSTNASTIIGDNCIIGACSVIYEGVVIGDNVLVGDGVKIRDGVRIGNNCIIGMNSKIGPRTVIGNNVKIMDLCNISGDSLVEDNVFIAQGVMTANDNYMGRDPTWEGGIGEHKGPVIRKYTTIGMGSLLLPNIIIGEDCIIAAGSVVTKDIKSGTLVKGIPARFIRNLEEGERKNG